VAKHRSALVTGLVVGLLLWCDAAGGCVMMAASFDKAVDLTELFSKFTALAGKGGLGDGWGVAFYPDASVAIHKEPIRAADSSLVKLLVEKRAIQSRLFTLHLRAASKRAVPSPRNTHPWVREWNRREYVLSLVGAADERLFTSIQPVHFKPLGENSGEWMLCHIVSQIKEQGVTEWDEDRFASLHKVLLDINAVHANTTLLVSDGTHLFAYASTKGAGVSYCRREMPAAKIQRKGKAVDDGAPATGYLVRVGGAEALAAPGDEWINLGAGQLVVFKDGKRIYQSQPVTKGARP
jgi:predicted glutamine amidotransferase